MMFLMVSEVSHLQNALLPVLGYIIAATGGAGIVFFLLMVVFRSDKSKNKEEMVNKLERMMKENTNFQNIKYVFLIIGGGWGFCHSLYAITNDNSVLYTDKFDAIETAQPEFIFKLDEELDFSKHTNNVGCDAPDCVMFRVENEKLHEMYHVGMYDNSPAVDEVTKIHYFVTHGLDKNGKRRNSGSDVNPNE